MQHMLDTVRGEVGQGKLWDGPRVGAADRLQGRLAHGGQIRLGSWIILAHLNC